MPRVVAADFTHELLDRDYLVQTMLPGVRAPEGLARYPRPVWASFYRQLGAATRRLHEVRGERFGRVLDGVHPTWGDALIASLVASAAELDAVGLPSEPIHRVAAAADRDRRLLDEVEPRLLHGDLWHVNVLVDPDTPEPTITGCYDSDRASWGDPLADWTIDRAQQRPGTERDAFWDTYGTLPTDRASRRRSWYYRALHRVGGRLDLHRRGLDPVTVPGHHWDFAPVLEQLASPT